MELIRFLVGHHHMFHAKRGVKILATILREGSMALDLSTPVMRKAIMMMVSFLRRNPRSEDSGIINVLGLHLFERSNPWIKGNEIPLMCVCVSVRLNSNDAIRGKSGRERAFAAHARSAFPEGRGMALSAELIALT